ncbi:hypothetical protein GTO91_11875 [Heliobacterium undosum]|uniref:Uncharacterized protein n=1 Tax=Heliomicrobium undosum TaxID=121734 RepID=A0A845LBW4_9FIRM|nr:hypothetical protein [Heliomicrobium undosum]MZP30411.1 hypothetical protein [Heliomicrobium undosum]
MPGKTVETVEVLPMHVALQYSKPDLWPLEPGPLGWKLLRQGLMTLEPRTARAPSEERRHSSWVYVEIPDTAPAVYWLVRELLPGPISGHVWLHIRAPQRFWEIYEEYASGLAEGGPEQVECIVEAVTPPENAMVHRLEDLLPEHFPSGPVWRFVQFLLERWGRPLSAD